MVGLYRCTEVPGQFVWEPGLLTRALLSGHWILIEDIDRKGGIFCSNTKKVFFYFGKPFQKYTYAKYWDPFLELNILNKIE